MSGRTWICGKKKTYQETYESYTLLTKYASILTENKNRFQRVSTPVINVTAVHTLEKKSISRFIVR